MNRTRRRRVRRSAIACAFVATVALAGACSSDDGDDAADGTTTSAAPATSAPTTIPLPDLPAAPAAADPTDQTPPVGTNGITIDAEGMLWIADGEGGQVLQVDPSTGEILQRWPTPEGAWPDDLAIDVDGRVFWTGFESGEVGRIDPSTDEHVIVATMPPGANPIAFSDDGRLYVGLAVTADGLYEIDPVGRDEPRLMAAEVGNVNGFDVGADGYLYGPRATGEVVQLDSESGVEISVLVEGMGFGSAVRQAPDGALYLLSTNPTPRLTRIELSEGQAGDVSEVAAIETQIADNFAISAPVTTEDASSTTVEGAPTAAFTFYVTTFNRPVVVVVDPDGTQTELAIGAASSAASTAGD